jgi:hypothetical protein
MYFLIFNIRFCCSHHCCPFQCVMVPFQCVMVPFQSQKRSSTIKHVVSLYFLGDAMGGYRGQTFSAKDKDVPSANDLCFPFGYSHSSLNCDNLHTTKHLYASLHNWNSMHRRLYFLLKMFVLCVLPLHLLKNIMTQRA